VKVAFVIYMAADTGVVDVGVDGGKVHEEVVVLLTEVRLKILHFKKCLCLSGLK
jgi:hypothetical protein